MEITPITMEVVRQKNYRLLREGHSEDTMKRNESALKYIEHLASITGTNITHWLPVKTFADADCIFPRERNKINEIFFRYRELDRENQVAKPVAAPTITDQEATAMCAKFDQTFAKNFDRMLKAELEYLPLAEQEYKRYQKETSKRLERLEQRKATIRGLELRKMEGTGVAADLKKTLAEGWWTISDEPDEGCICLLTPEIRLTFSNEPAKIFNAVNLGRIQVELSADSEGNMVPRAYKYDKNVIDSGYFHPHVSSEGNVCFGNMEDKYYEAANAFKLYAALDILKAVLTNYCDDSPYIELHSLESAAKRGQIYEKGKTEENRKAIREFLERVRFTPPPPQARSQPQNQAPRVEVRQDWGQSVTYTMATNGTAGNPYFQVASPSYQAIIPGGLDQAPTPEEVANRPQETLPDESLGF